MLMKNKTDKVEKLNQTLEYLHNNVMIKLSNPIKAYLTFESREG